MRQAADPIAPDLVPQRLQAAVSAIAAVARDLSARIARHHLSGDLSAARGSNSDGDQKALDVIADDAFAAALAEAGVRHYASEERRGRSSCPRATWPSRSTRSTAPRTST